MTLWLLIIILTMLLVFLIYEAVMTSGRVGFLRHRIIVNGTRGKSSVVELIHAGLMSEPTLGKITGVTPQLILPDGTHSVIKRRGRARVQEQIRTLKTGVKLRVSNIVLECMSINPELQKLETRVIRPTVYVITNIREDHFEVMGKTLPEQAESICNAIPENSIVVTGEVDFLQLIKEKAKARNSKMVVVSPREGESDFSKLNSAIALEVCRLSGAEKGDATRRIEAKAEELTTDVYDIPCDSKFINGFAVNDTSSAKKFLEKFRTQYNYLRKLVIVLNTRNDRPFRSLEFACWIKEIENEDLHSIVLTGNHTGYAARKLKNLGISRSKIMIWKNKDFKSAADAFQNAGFDKSLILGIGNIAGSGFSFLQSLQGEYKE